MIIDEVKLVTKKELEVLLNKLSKEEYTWYSGKKLELYPILDVYPVYIQITEDKRILWNYCHLQKEHWSEW